MLTLLEIKTFTYTIELRLEVEGKAVSLTIPREEGEALTLPTPPAPLEEEAYTVLLELSELQKAIKQALNALSKGAHSKKALFQKLLKKGVSKDHAKNAVLKAVRYGYIREEEDIRLWLMQDFRKQYGPKRTKLALAQKGYPEVLVARVMADLQEAGELDYRAAEKELFAALLASGLPPHKAKAKLERLGFGEDWV